MPLLYSPVDGTEISEAVEPLPKSAFLMIHDNDRVSAVEAQMQKITREELESAGFQPKAASDLRRTGDFLAKIIRMIRGCGFGVAVFSDATPPRTIANIFFEVGYCLALGKPTYILVAGKDAVPSDFVRSEWIMYDPSKDDVFRDALKAAFQDMQSYGNFLYQLALTAEDAEEIDPELAFERFRRAYLISGSQDALDGIGRIHNKIRSVRDDKSTGILMRSHRRSLSDQISHFLRLCQDLNP